MEKIIRIDKEHSLKVDNNLEWMMIYKSQFGHDIVPEIMPIVGAISEMIGSLAAGGIEIKSAEDFVQRLDKEILTNMLVELTGLEFVSFINMCWALAKSADPDIEEPRVWIKQFNTFPVDILAPEIFELIVRGVVSEKNWKRLQSQMKSLRPKKKDEPTSSKSSPQESLADSQ